MNHCSHKGIGEPGCPTCDPDKARVINTLRGRLSTLMDALSSVEAEQRVAFEAESDLCEERAERAEAKAIEAERVLAALADLTQQQVEEWNRERGALKAAHEAALDLAAAHETAADQAEAAAERLEATAVELARIVHYADCSECRKKLRLKNDCLDAHHVEAREALAAARATFGYASEGGGK